MWRVFSLIILLISLSGSVFGQADYKRYYDEAGELVGPKPPGLHIKRCWTCANQDEVSCPGLNVDLSDHQAVLLASVPLDDRGWEGLEEGTVLALKDGEILRQA